MGCCSKAIKLLRTRRAINRISGRCNCTFIAFGDQNANKVVFQVNFCQIGQYCHGTFSIVWDINEFHHIVFKKLRNFIFVNFDCFENRLKLLAAVAAPNQTSRYYRQGPHKNKFSAQGCRLFPSSQSMRALNRAFNREGFKKKKGKIWSFTKPCCNLIAFYPSGFGPSGLLSKLS